MTVPSPTTSSIERPETSPQPGFKQFWPWFLFALPGSVVIAGIITLLIANNMADDRLTGYKKVGLAVIATDTEVGNIPTMPSQPQTEKE